MPSIAVLEAHQKPTDKPTRRIKRSGGQSLHAQGKADWIIKNVLLQMRPEASGAQKMAAARTEYDRGARRAYIPEKLPASIDGMLGLIVQAPVLPNQVRFRHV